MMRIILLLLVTLTGPLCTFTLASTLVVPTASDQEVTAVTESVQPAPTKTAEAQASFSTEASAAESSTEGAIAETDAPVTITQPEVPAETTTPTSPAEEPVTEEPVTTEALTAVDEALSDHAETQNTTVVVEDQEAAGTGQLVGIVIGALIAVIVVIAVIILVVRRMGQYSISKKRKPQKQEGILNSTLKRRSARQQEKKNKFWKF